MDEKSNQAIANAFEYAKYKRVIFNQRDLLKSRVDAKLTLGYSGGLFKVEPALIQYVIMLINLGHQETAILDKNELPIMIDNLEKFKEELLNRYLKVVNQYYLEYENLKKVRGSKEIFGD
ncbi:MAG: hypothetical protein HN353_08285 [Bdellovibrionales bacterium]|jgi:hypothetical protein|nr:hypothetical protein [Bdellovibrionales bacterium]MBT3525919.1 hypothetical protein [Bdellovibrionales bacterium]MBT7669135.1 hypothetical protein [Bdellovibrionales bacterium]MBT7765719.1 hypothetical protein [Bdellovibrionales bacterium]